MKNHILYQLKFEVNASSEMYGRKLQQDISKLSNGRLLQTIESVFDKIGQKKNIRIPKLELEIDAVPSDNWEAVFIQKLSQQLYKEINNWEENNLKERESNSNLNIPQEDSLFYFLENGTLPWHNNSLTINELKEYFNLNIKIKFFQSTLIDLLVSNEKALKRFIFQFDKKETQHLLNIILKDSKLQISFFEKLENLYTKWWNKNEVKFQIWKSFFKNHFDKKLNLKELQIEITKKTFLFFSKENTTNDRKENIANILLAKLKEITPSINLEEFLAHESFKNKTSTFEKNQFKNQSKRKSIVNISNQEGFYINNAGLIILHPFFQYLFDELGFTNKNEFVSSHNQYQAALALHYLVTGKETAFEPDLIFNKILCNIPIQEPIENQFLINEKFQEECDNLLNATIQHWAALKSTSIDGLRNTFLQREGKISQKENGDWLLQVQSSGVDVLLSKLPWGIGIVKLPWMDENLFVEWV